MTEHAAGWFNDPYGRYQQRYWNGSAWTEHVATNGVQQVDPMGDSSVIPFATPASASTTTDEMQPFATPPQSFAPAADPSDLNAQAPTPQPAADGNHVTRFLDGMGDDARLRPRPSLRTAMAGIGGLFVAAGVLVVAAGDDISRGTLIATSLVLLIAALAARLAVKVTEVQSAAVGIAVVAIPTFAAAVAVSDGTSGVLVYLLAAALFLAAWALRGFRGRTLLLGLGLLALVGGFSTLISEIGQDKCESYIQANDFDRYFDECQDYTGDGGGESLFLPISVTDNLGSEGIVYLVSATLLLGATWWLDRRGYHGTGTGTVVAGLQSAVLGATLLANEFGDVGGPLLLLAIGFLICIVGTHGNRRATTWWGAVLAAIGVVSFVVVQWKPGSISATGGSLVVAGLALVGIPFLIAPLRAALAKRNEPPQPQPPQPFGPPAG